MKRADLLKTIKITPDQLNKLVGKVDVNLIDSDEIPDNIAREIIERNKAHQQQQSTTQPAAAIGGDIAEDETLIQSAIADSQLTLTDDAFVLGHMVGDNLAQAYGQGLYQGYSRGLGKFTDRFRGILANSVVSVSPQELQTTFGGDSALSSAMKIRAMRDQKKTLPPSRFDSSKCF